jgi:hypothetical protein
MTEQDIFKKYPFCGKIWPTRDAFILDTQLTVDGYQPDFECLEEGLFLFTHHQLNCYSTMAVTIKEFVDLYNGIRYTERKTGLSECKGNCLDIHNFKLCKAKCECAYIREVLNIICEQKKTSNYDSKQNKDRKEIVTP